MHPENSVGRPRKAAPKTREGLGREGWNKYHRDRRASMKGEQRPRPLLDCSRPPKALFTTDQKAYYAQLQRYRRAYLKEHGTPPASIRAPKPGVDYSAPPRSLFHVDPAAYKAQYQRFWRAQKRKART